IGRGCDAQLQRGAFWGRRSRRASAAPGCPGHRAGLTLPFHRAHAALEGWLETEKSNHVATIGVETQALARHWPSKARSAVLEGFRTTPTLLADGPGIALAASSSFQRVKSAAAAFWDRLHVGPDLTLGRDRLERRDADDL